MRELLDFLLCCFRGHEDEVVLELSWEIELRRCSRCGRLRTGATMAAWAAPLAAPRFMLHLVKLVDDPEAILVRGWGDHHSKEATQ